MGGASAVITAEARPSVGAAWADKDARPETKAFCKIAPKTAHTQDDRKRRRYPCQTHSPYSAEAARNPAMKLMKATANQSSSVGMAKIMAHVGVTG